MVPGEKVIMYELRKANLLKGERIYNCPIPVVALSGSIATGKSTVTKMLKERGFHVICADELIHQIYEQDKAKTIVLTHEPSAIKDDLIDFKKLRLAFFTNSTLKKELEEYLYSQLPYYFNRSLGHHKVVIYDVPLLYEKGLEKFTDLHGIVYTNSKTQLERLQLRDYSYTEESLEKVLSHQISIEEKKEKAQFVIDNNLGLNELKNEVESFIAKYFIKD